MYVERIILNNFRNYEYLDLCFYEGLNIFYGDNAQGKTNILEAIYTCGTGRSHRTNNDKEMIMHNQNESHIILYLSKDGAKERIDIHIKENTNKGVAVNRLPIKKLNDLIGILNIVIFSPEDLKLVKSGPKERRRFIDLELCQLDKTYCSDLQNYHKVLKQRNKLLKTRDKNIKDILFSFDIQIVDYGKRLINKRNAFVNKIDNIVKDIHREITMGKEELSIVYESNVSIDDYEKRLNHNIDKDIMYGNTSIGPHKDDLSFIINGIDVRKYGSQGQQRTSALSLKLSEIDIIKKETGNKPVLLLDDVLSELDINRQSYIINHIDTLQTIITCTGIDNTLYQCKSDRKVFKVVNGTIHNTCVKKKINI